MNVKKYLVVAGISAAIFSGAFSLAFAEHAALTGESKGQVTGERRGHHKGSKASFTFTNNTKRQVNDLHMEFNTAVDVTGTGAFTTLTDNNTSHPTLSGGAVAAAATSSTSVTGQANKTHLKKWWWTLDGKQVGPTHEGCKAPDCTSP